MLALCAGMIDGEIWLDIAFELGRFRHNAAINQKGKRKQAQSKHLLTPCFAMPSHSGHKASQDAYFDQVTYTLIYGESSETNLSRSYERWARSSEQNVWG